MDYIVVGVVVLFFLLYARRLVRSARSEIAAGLRSGIEDGNEDR